MDIFGRATLVGYFAFVFFLIWGLSLWVNTPKVYAQSSLPEMVTFGDLIKKIELKEDKPQLPLAVFNSLLTPLTAQKAIATAASEKSPKSVLEAFLSTKIDEVDLDLDQYFETYASQYQVDCNQLKSIAHCESGFNPNAVNDIYSGLFQFSPSTWQVNRNRMGLDPNPDLRYSAEEAIKTAAFKISQDGTGAWPVCQYR
ncbi:hypothetical protein A2160_00095 [Candidatus Beckwithbacteria bacterium RBG_13_42_9]|uniref:Resuscitation-promoting factor core lysozyme-like domain-containing protein n=1 Tax=Candidatus Beckwithbacteria bacterium RBG_13_42_9 TaxID=1797457 RepID=A0A1F5E578_9BACT|nr:MAG: hypothetical protein A2160_00095 [Candidatus Beckwithbacteria bacterium RBG_13_42_9]